MGVISDGDLPTFTIHIDDVSEMDELEAALHPAYRWKEVGEARPHLIVELLQPGFRVKLVGGDK